MSRNRKNSGLRRKMSFDTSNKLGMTLGKGSSGNVVKTVSDGGAFAKNGVQAGWTLSRVNKTSVSSSNASDELKSAMRKGGELMLEFAIPEMASGGRKEKVMFDRKKKLGFSLESSSNIVKSVVSRGAAVKLGVQKGWVVICVDGTNVDGSNARSVLKKTHKGRGKYMIIFATEKSTAKNKMIMSLQLSPRAVSPRECKESEQKSVEAQEAEQKAKEESEMKEKLEAEQRAKEEAEQKEKEEAEQRAKEEAEQKEKEEAELRAKEEEERKAREEAELKLKEEERKAQEEADRKAKEEEEKRLQEEAELKAKEEAEQKAKQEAELKAKEEAERAARAEAERLEREEAERKAEDEAKQAAEVDVTQEVPEQQKADEVVLNKEDATGQENAAHDAEVNVQADEARDEQKVAEHEAVVSETAEVIPKAEETEADDKLPFAEDEAKIESVPEQAETEVQSGVEVEASPEEKVQAETGSSHVATEAVPKTDDQAVDEEAKKVEAPTGDTTEVVQLDKDDGKVSTAEADKVVEVEDELNTQPEPEVEAELKSQPEPEVQPTSTPSTEVTDSVQKVDGECDKQELKAEEQVEVDEVADAKEEVSGSAEVSKTEEQGTIADQEIRAESEQDRKDADTEVISADAIANTGETREEVSQEHEIVKTEVAEEVVLQPKKEEQNAVQQADDEKSCSAEEFDNKTPEKPGTDQTILDNIVKADETAEKNTIPLNEATANATDC